ncbi:MAG: hypothetical protein R3C14_21995 [Caldilineaceae bacterium]
MPSEPISAPESAAALSSSTATERRAQKRVAIGLAPERPTAKTEVQRPPRPPLSAGQRWFLTLLLLALLATTLLLAVARANGAPTAWPQVRAYLTSWLAGQPAPRPIGGGLFGTRYQLLQEDAFVTRTGLLACNQQAGQWWMDVVPDEGLYRMSIWPGRVAWSTLATVTPSAYRLDASFTLADLMPDSYAGFVGRYQDAANFYLFVVDGHGRYQVQLWQQGVLTTLQPWTSNPLLNGAGFENVLTLEDDGERLHFGANGGELYVIITSSLPSGQVGVLGGAGARTMAEIVINWLRLYKGVQ